MLKDIYTRKQWEIDKTFQAKEGQQITKEIYNHFLNVLPPIYISCYTYGSYTDIFLCSEPTNHAPDNKGISALNTMRSVKGTKNSIISGNASLKI